MTQWRNLFSLEVFFEKGYVVLNGLNTTSKSYGEEVLNIAKNRSLTPCSCLGKKRKMFILKLDNSFEKEIIEFNKSIIKNTKPIIGNSLEALQLMKIVDKIYNFS